MRVYLVWGFEEGANKIHRSCPGAAILIQQPRGVVGPARANQSGVATFEVLVPPSARGLAVRLQATSPATCDVSHVVEHAFE